MILPPFEGPRLKIRRAQKHITDLEQCVTEFGASVKLTMVPVKEEGELICYLMRFNERPPEDIPALVGDALHNLRSALDILICDIARLRGKSVDKLKFPFAANVEALEKILSKDFPRLGEDVVDGIRAQQPFIGGNLALRGLHDLDIDDKHETVLPCYLVARGRFAAERMVPAGVLDWVAGMGLDFRMAQMAIHEGNVMWSKAGANPWLMIQPLDGPPQPTFPDGLPFAGIPILEVLEGLTEVVGQVVECFAAEFGGGNDDTTRGPTLNN